MMIFPPAVAAKIVATLDQIAPGRIGLNVVTGLRPQLMRQLGLWRELAHDERYDRRRRVDHRGEAHLDGRQRHAQGQVLRD